MLSKTWETHFQSSTEQFRIFCNKICSSKFLTGEKTNTEFKANITWLFKAETIDRIFADEFDIGNRKTDQEQSEMKRYLSEKAQLAAQEKIRELKKEQEIQQQQNDYREKLKSFETLSHSQKETLKTEFKQSNFLQKKTAFWKEESEKSELDSVD